MSAIKYIGNYDVTAEGKFLWEILCQLRGLGVGRMVTKNEWGRKWPHQPSYLRIVKFMGEVEATRLKIMIDWRLIHKHEEEEFMKCDQPMGDIEVPNSFPLPPLQIHLAVKYAKKNGLNIADVQQRAPLEVCIDPEFEMLRPFIKKIHLAVKYAKKNGLNIADVQQRAPLEVCIDPEFEMLRPFIKKVDPPKKAKSIYEEANPDVWLDLYGKELPTKVEAWNVGPAEMRQRFSSTAVAKSSKEIAGATV
ncbi:hypothetical protein Tcan_16840 [Toxocara canis]|uniref:28S ribosomal protein S34, mitochondrial n=1 Tax=Toxocara canis TaxID=6265 RepID=A0A0B2VEF7_TOXCA|nr:hypothetical protein Tcan_16840 [Toxocara canis]